MAAFRKLGFAVLALCWLVGCGSTHDDDNDADGGDGDGDGAGRAAPEGPMCLGREVVAEVATQASQSIDMVFAVANTPSMADEQVALAAQFPRLINVLSSGDVDGDGAADFPPVESLRFAVVSSDLGLPGVNGVDGCFLLGDEGRFRNTASEDIIGCSSATYNPPFLTFTAEVDDAAVTANDLACIATLGTDGCTIQQPLESMLKAVWPGNDHSVTFVTDPSGFGMFGNAGAGFANGDFLRDDSLIALVVVTDGEDCSSRSMDHFQPDASANGLGTRCYYEGTRGLDSNLFQVERYIQLFKMLRPGLEENVFFAAIAGVPSRLTESDLTQDYDFATASQAAAYADMVLSDAEMMERVDDKQTPAVLNDDGIIPSCNRGENALAYPPRRLVEVARGMGANGIIDSICRDDLAPAIDNLIARLRTRLGVPCLPRPIVRDAEGKLACDVLWEMPRNASCDDLPFLVDLDKPGATGGPICQVPQLAVDGDDVDGGDGWYYDDFSDTARTACVGSDKQRIAFSETAEPPPGVIVRLACFDASYYVGKLGDENELAPVQQPKIGSPCEDVTLRNREVSGDDACVRLLQNGDEDRSMFCHQESKYCALNCGDDDDCPELWFCDDTQSTVSAAGRAMCSPGMCSAGPASASTEAVGDPCLPAAVPENGFDESTVYIGGNEADCGGGACIVFHLDGDPRQDCSARGGCDPSSGTCGDFLRCADAADLEKRVYCSCRCDAPEGFAECECPSGFSCVEAIDNGPPEIAGSYCVRNSTVAL